MFYDRLLGTVLFTMEITKEIQDLRKEVEKWVKDNPNSGLFGDIPNRSCWNCNGAHEHLKQADYPIQCFDCGHIYYKGIQLTFEEDV